MAVQGWRVYSSGANDEVQFWIDYEDTTGDVLDVRYQNLTNYQAYADVRLAGATQSTRYVLPANQPMITRSAGNNPPSLSTTEVSCGWPLAAATRNP